MFTRNAYIILISFVTLMLFILAIEHKILQSKVSSTTETVKVSTTENVIVEEKPVEKKKTSSKKMKWLNKQPDELKVELHGCVLRTRVENEKMPFNQEIKTIVNTVVMFDNGTGLIDFIYIEESEHTSGNLENHMKTEFEKGKKWLNKEAEKRK